MLKHIFKQVTDGLRIGYWLLTNQFHKVEAYSESSCTGVIVENGVARPMTESEVKAHLEGAKAFLKEGERMLEEGERMLREKARNKQ
jgi:hypothetical protein